MIGGGGIEGLLMSPNQLPYKYLEVEFQQFLKLNFKLTSSRFNSSETDHAFLFTVYNKSRLFS